MTDRLLGLQTFALPEEELMQTPEMHTHYQGASASPDHRTVADRAIDFLTGTTTPDPAQAQQQVEAQVTGGTGEGFPFQQGGELEITGEQAQAIQPAAVGIVDAMAAGTPAAIKAVAKAGPDIVEAGMVGFEQAARAGLAPQVRMAAAPDIKRVDWQLDQPVVGKRAVQDFLKHHGIEAHPDIIESGKAKGMTGQEWLDAHETRNKLMTELAHNPKPIKEMNQEELGAYGDLFGVNLHLTPVEEVLDEATGQVWQIPGGLDKPLSITDAYWLKAQAYDPTSMSDGFQAKLQQKLTAATTPDNPDDPFENFNRAMFGMQSPNTPLLANQFMTSRMRVRNDQQLDDLAALIDWEPGAKVSAEKRRQVDKRIGRMYGIQSAAEGGMAMRSSADLTNVAEMAKLYKQHPDFFKKKPDESWQDFSERLIAVQRGLAPKTGSFGAVWQDPGQATTSAMDRHMARNFRPVVMNDPEIGPGIEAQRIKLWNQQLADSKKLHARKKLNKAEKAKLATLPPAGATKVKTYQDILDHLGGDEWDLAQIVVDSTKHSNPKYRLANGQINPAIPEHLRDLPIEPEKVTIFGPIYRRMLEENERRAQEQGLNVFAEQWRIWDRIRKQIEPHESMHKDMQKLPAMSAQEQYEAFKHQKQAGFHSSGLKKTGERYVSPFDYRQGMAWGTAAGTVVPGMMNTEEDGDI